MVDLIALRALLRARERAAAEALVGEAARRASNPREEAWLQQAWAELSLGNQDLPRCDAHARAALAAAEAQGDEALLAEAVRTLGITSLYRAEMPRSKALLERARGIFARRGDRAGEADTTRFLGYHAQERGRWDEATEAYDAAVALYAAAGDDYGRCNALRGAAHAWLMRGDLDAAQRTYEQARGLLEPWGPSSALASTWSGLGDVAAHRGDAAAAEAHYLEALGLHRTNGDPFGTPVTLDSLANLARETGDLARAEALLREGLGLIEATHPLGHHLAANLALVLALATRFDELAALLERTAHAPEVVAGRRAVAALALAAHLGDGRATDAILRTGWRSGDEHAALEPLLLRAASDWEARSGVEAASRAARILARCLPGDQRATRLRALGRRGAPVVVGRFELVAPVGRGGMGTVWRARDQTDHTAVAVKVLHVGRDRGGALAHEIRAMATLDHPHIVRVLGHGLVDDVASEMSGGEIIEGSHYLVMEFVGGGDLSRLRGRLTWDELRQLVDQLLQALAHAHARGLVHLDLKPENVLLEGGAERRARLTDLGIARALQGLHATEGVFGTPSSMAPEQATGDWGDVGPWTDLYAVGCLVWTMVAGRPPFVADDPTELLIAHVARPLPALDATIPVPEGLEAWLRVLLAKAPAARYGRALEALDAMRALGPAVDATIATRSQGPEHAEVTWVAGVTSRVDPAIRSYATADTRRPGAWSATATRLERGVETSSNLADPSLIAWRTPPLAGRARERMAAATLLADVAAGAAGALLVTGRAGAGATRFATWLAEVAHQGGADVAWLRYSDNAGPFPVALRDLARLHGLGARQVFERLGTRVDRATAQRVTDALVAEMAPQPGDTRELLASLARDRPLVLVADDAHRHPAALSDLRAALESGLMARILWVGTAREERLETHEATLAQLEALGLRRLALPPLGREELQAAIRHIVVLDPRLEARLLDRAAGSPQYAMQVVGGWVERGALAPSPDGLRLADGSDIALPEALADAQGARLDAVCPPGTDLRAVVELAAVLGSEVSVGEWHAAARVAGLALPEDAVEVLSRAGVAARTDAGWRFAHAMIHEAVLARLPPRDLPDLHAAAAAALQGVAGAQGRRGRHLLASGRPLEALEPLAFDANRAIREGRHASAAELLDAWERGADAAGLAPDDPSRLRALALEAELVTTFGSTRFTADRYALALALARAEPDPVRRGRALEQLAHVPDSGGRFAEALELLGEAEAVFEVADNPLGLADVRAARMHVGPKVGAVAEAARLAPGVLAAYEALGFPRQVAMTRLQLAQLEVARGRLDAARDEATVAAAWYRDAGDRVYEAHCTNVLGIAARRAGELELAETHFASAERLLRTAGSPAWIFPRMNRGLLAFLAGRTEEGRAAFDQSALRATQLGWGSVAGMAEVMAACCDPLGPDFNQAMVRGEELAAGGARDADVALGCARAADRVAQASPERAARLRALSKATAVDLSEDATQRS